MIPQWIANVYYLLLLTAREGSRTLQSLSPEKRADIIYTLADLLVKRQNDISNANKRDIEKAKQEGNFTMTLYLYLFTVECGTIFTPLFPSFFFCGVKFAHSRMLKGEAFRCVLSPPPPLGVNTKTCYSRRTQL